MFLAQTDRQTDRQTELLALAALSAIETTTKYLKYHN
jgi:hypothetical protein